VATFFCILLSQCVKVEPVSTYRSGKKEIVVQQKLNSMFQFSIWIMEPRYICYVLLAYKILKAKPISIFPCLSRSRCYIVNIIWVFFGRLYTPAGQAFRKRESSASDSTSMTILGPVAPVGNGNGMNMAQTMSYVNKHRRLSTTVTGSPASTQRLLNPMHDTKNTFV
jgi:hypothetical protein